MKALLIIICCILLINWGLDGRYVHMTSIHWDYGFPYSFAEIMGSGVFIVAMILLVIGVMFGAVAVVGAAIFMAFATVLCALVSALWPIAVVVALLMLFSSNKNRRHY